jgi:hypothetical protein
MLPHCEMEAGITAVADELEATVTGRNVSYGIVSKPAGADPAGFLFTLDTGEVTVKVMTIDTRTPRPLVEIPLWMLIMYSVLDLAGAQTWLWVICWSFVALCFLIGVAVGIAEARRS